MLGYMEMRAASAGAAMSKRTRLGGGGGGTHHLARILAHKVPRGYRALCEGAPAFPSDLHA